MASQQLKGVYVLKFQFQRYILKFLSDQMPMVYNNTVLVHNNTVLVPNNKDPEMQRHDWKQK